MAVKVLLCQNRPRLPIGPGFSVGNSDWFGPKKKKNTELFKMDWNQASVQPNSHAHIVYLGVEL